MREIAVDKSRDSGFDVAHDKKIEETRERLRVCHGTDAPSHDNGVASFPLSGQRAERGTGEQARCIDVIHFKREGDKDEFEGAQRSMAFK
jgi:hypothetical protein